MWCTYLSGSFKKPLLYNILSEIFRTNKCWFFWLTDPLRSRSIVEKKQGRMISVTRRPGWLESPLKVLTLSKSPNNSDEVMLDIGGVLAKPLHISYTFMILPFDFHWFIWLARSNFQFVVHQITNKRVIYSFTTTSISFGCTYPEPRIILSIYWKILYYQRCFIRKLLASSCFQNNMR